MMVSSFIHCVRICVIILLGIKCDLYFPKLHDYGYYSLKSDEKTSLNYFIFNNSETTIVGLKINDSNTLLASIIRTNSTGTHQNNNNNNECWISAVNLTRIGSHCRIGKNFIKISEEYLLCVVKCDHKISYVMKIILSNSCLIYAADLNETNILLSVEDKSDDNSQELVLKTIGVTVSDNFAVIWIKRQLKYKIISSTSLNENGILISDWKEVKRETLPSHLINSHVKDIGVHGEHLFIVLEDLCLHYCLLENCTKLRIAKLDQCENNINSGILQVAITSSWILRLAQINYEPISEKISTPTYTLHYDFFCYSENFEIRNYDINILNKDSKSNKQQPSTDHWVKCGNFKIENVVIVESLSLVDLSEVNPCELSNDGNMLSCLILGEPYIFDISDKLSAHPISSFDVSSWRIGTAVYKFGFSSEKSFYFEIISSKRNLFLEEVITGYIFDIERFLQPSLISSQVIYPTLATSITPSESFLLVNHNNLDLWLFTHAGRIFYREGSAELFKVDLQYDESVSFFISDFMESISNTSSQRSRMNSGHNFEHPFAFFSPDRTHMFFVSYYKSASGSFAASSATIIKFKNGSSSVEKHSLVHIGNKPFLIQAGIDHSNEFLFILRQHTTNKYLSLNVFEISRIPEVTSNTANMRVQIELEGMWTWSDFDSGESSKIWIICFFKPNHFIIASHKVDDEVYTNLTEFAFDSNWKIKLIRSIIIETCIAITNENDYINGIIIVLCAETRLTNQENQTFKIVFVDYTSGLVICSHRLLYHFGIVEDSFDDLKPINIPNFDYDPTTHRLVISCEKEVFLFYTKLCPFQLLYHYKHHHIISSIATLNIINQKTTYGITLISYLQKLDALSDCINGFSLVAGIGNSGFYCSRCRPGYFGIGCLPCPAGFVCNGYGQLQPTSPCPEGYYCLQGTGSNKIIIIDNQMLFTDKEENQIFSNLEKPRLCPSGSYCPAGTTQAQLNETLNTAPQLCIEGYYCPEGSKTPTEFSCPSHSTSKKGSKSFVDCYCENGYFGIAINKGYCVKCFKYGVCNRTSGSENLTTSMIIPPGYWSNTPDETHQILPCRNISSKDTPCLETSCSLFCNNSHIITQSNQITKCLVKCNDNCIDGHEGRLCSKCKSGYYLKSNMKCEMCSFGTKQSVFLFISVGSIAFILAIIVYRNYRTRSFQNEREENYFISNDQLLELLLTIILIAFGISSATTLIIIILILVITYLEQLDSPQYAKTIFIFYIQTLQALISGKYTWPPFLEVLTDFFDAIYTPVPGLACVVNIYTGQTIGWIGGAITAFTFPLLFGVVLLFIHLLVGKLYNNINLSKWLNFYCFFMFIMQFPLSSLSLNALACQYDIVTNKYFMISQPWIECSLNGFVQWIGIFGVIIYFFGVPIIMSVCYWNLNVSEQIKKFLESLIIPTGMKSGIFYPVFLILRGMLLVVIVTIIPTAWDLRRPLIICLFGANILILAQNNHYNNPLIGKEKTTRGEDLQIKENIVNILRKVQTGEFLEISSLSIIIFSYLIMDTKSSILNEKFKSSLVGIVNIIYIHFYFLFVLMEHRIHLFNLISNICCWFISRRNNQLKLMHQGNFDKK